MSTTSDDNGNKDQEKGDEVLRRLLKTPPDHKTGKGKEKPKGNDDAKKDSAPHS